jgi:alkylhydroperoxidase/carboxymuconolactone decarboxylase family protein YurZ
MSNIKFGFAAKNEYGQWLPEVCGQQDASNTFATREEADAHVDDLASVMGLEASEIRVVEIEVVKNVASNTEPETEQAREAVEVVVKQIDAQVTRLRVARRRLPNNGWAKWAENGVGVELHSIALQLDEELSRRVTLRDDLLQLLTETAPIDRLVSAAESLRVVPRDAAIIAALSSHDRGDGCLGVMVRAALRNDPNATIDEIRQGIIEAEADAAAEREVAS